MMNWKHHPTTASNPDDADAARAAALRLLARREHTHLELRQKLLQRGFASSLVDDLLQQLADADLLSDARHAEVYAAGRVDKGYGPLRIERELRERGVAADLVQLTLQNLENLWLPALAELHRKRFAAIVPVDTAGQVQQLRFLRHRGFTLEQINHLFRSLQP
jgi:regulatory protein